MELRKVSKPVQSRAMKQVYLTITRNFAFKLFLVGFVILFAFSIAIYFVEKDYIHYAVVDGKRIEDSDRSSNIRTFQ